MTLLPDDDSPSISVIITDDQNQENNPQRFRGMMNLLGSVDGLFYFDAAVYSCSRDSWRIFRPKDLYLLKIKDVVEHIYGNAYLNGAYYWLLTGNDNCSILSFDFGSEVFEEIGGPDDHSVHNYVLGLMLLDDSIAILNMFKSFVFDIWIMIQPRIWNNLVTFQCFTEIKSCFDSSLILVTRVFRLVSYNVRTKKTRHLGFRHSGLKRFTVLGGCGVYCYKESLVTMKRGEVGH
ncbi:uncharacterized protein LOC132629139 [Lycium barbarum]|uniref:uncharacterized protein LOC132629139 n=1 Tax=Lycium barbarum TaxID=112863 RepID=UPI00293EE1D9|nr:uncharacterized protein LOC132629139 [Lycium barbarum]